MIRAIGDKILKTMVNGESVLNVGVVIADNTTNFVVANGTKVGENINLDSVENACRNFNSYRILKPQETKFTLFITHYPTVEQSKIILNCKDIEVVVTLFPFKNEDGINMLTDNGVKVVIEPLTMNDILITEDNVILKRVDMDRVSKSGIIIPDFVAQSRNRLVPCEVVACDLENEKMKEGDIVAVDIMSCQWFTFLDHECKEAKYFTTLTSEIICKMEGQLNG